MLLISREYPPFIGGGIGTYTVRMARALADQGREPVVVTVGDSAAATVREERGVRVVRLPFLGFVDGQPDWSGPRASILESASGPACHAAFWAFHRESVLAMQLREHLPWLLETFRPRAIEAPDTGAVLWFLLNERRLGRGPFARMGADGPPIIVHLHSPTAWIEELQGGPQPGRPMAELRSMERDVLRWADGVACPSRALAEWAGRSEPSAGERVRVTPYPLGERVDAGAPLPGQREALFVGRMERRKGFDTLVDALAVLGEAAPAVRVAGRDTMDWIANEHFGAAAIERRLGGEGGRVELLGELAPDALRHERYRCAIAVVPSPDDNYPNTCMEAMAAGQVTIAARAGGMAEMIEDGVSGLLFAPGDADDLAGMLERATAMSAEQRAAIGRAARERIATICDDAAVVARRLEHASSLSPTLPEPAGEREVAIVTFGPVEDGLRAAMTDALRANADLDAVAPWFARVGPDGREVVPFSTPSAEHAELLVDHPGPFAVDATWWRRLEAAGAESLAGGGGPGVLDALVRAGARVAVLPEAIAGPSQADASGRPGSPTPVRLSDAERTTAYALRERDEARDERGLVERELEAAEREAQEARDERDAIRGAMAELRSSRAYRLAHILSRVRRRLLG